MMALSKNSSEHCIASLLDGVIQIPQRLDVEVSDLQFDSRNVRKGDVFALYSKGEPLIDPETGFNLGSEEEFLCTITITRLMPKFSTGRKGEDCRGLEINRGDLVRVDE